jgi:hypothetical protein
MANTDDVSVSIPPVPLASVAVPAPFAVATVDPGITQAPIQPVATVIGPIPMAPAEGALDTSFMSNQAKDIPLFDLSGIVHELFNPNNP